jgi:hypothetical protein
MMLNSCSVAYNKRIVLSQENTFQFPARMPCGIINFNSRVAMDASWLISVHALFMINITIFETYIPYADDCKNNYISVYEGHNVIGNQLLGRMCGHVLHESFYTKYHQAKLHCVVVLLRPMAFHAEYNIQIQGYAYRGLPTKILGSANFELDIPDPASWLYFNQNFVEYIWYYTLSTFPVPLTNIFGRQAELENTISHIHGIEICITEFVCQDNTSQLRMYDGLLPLGWIKQYREVCTCSEDGMFLKHAYKHKYLTILLSINIITPSLIFTMHFNVSKEVLGLKKEIILREHQHTTQIDSKSVNTKHAMVNMYMLKQQVPQAYFKLVLNWAIFPRLKSNILARKVIDFAYAGNHIPYHPEGMYVYN